MVQHIDKACSLLCICYPRSLGVCTEWISATLKGGIKQEFVCILVLRVS